MKLFISDSASILASFHYGTDFVYYWMKKTTDLLHPIELYIK